VKIKYLNVGEIHGFRSQKTNPPKFKFHICVGKSTFLLVNTENKFPPSVVIRKSIYEFLEYDSYVCCSQIITYDGEIEINNDSRKGTATTDLMRKVCEAISSARTLNKIQRDTIIQKIKTEISKRADQQK
jgi:mRNA-degrading endonuclease toxin of MazEF toxin-antitoxin module